MKANDVLTAAMIFISTLASGEAAHATSAINDFDIRRCEADGRTCFEATGKFAYISMDGTSISGDAAVLSVHSREANARKISCASFRFNLRSGFLICDNRDQPRSLSLTIGPDFKMTETF